MTRKYDRSPDDIEVVRPLKEAWDGDSRESTLPDRTDPDPDPSGRLPGGPRPHGLLHLCFPRAGHSETAWMLGASLLLGGLNHRVQEFNRVGARFQASLLFLATIALLVPSAIARADFVPGAVTQSLSLGLAVLLIVTYGLGMLFSLKTHRGVRLVAQRREHPVLVGLRAGEGRLAHRVLRRPGGFLTSRDAEAKKAIAPGAR